MPNSFYCIFRHLKLELLTQFPALNDEKYVYLLKITSSKLNYYLTNWASTTNYIIHFSDKLFKGLKSARNSRTRVIYYIEKYRKFIGIIEI